MLMSVERLFSVRFNSVEFPCCSNKIKLIEQQVNLFGTGLTNLSPHAMTLLSGFVAVISVNIVIAFYIYMAMKEPSNTHQADPKFLTHAKASVYQPTGEPMESLKKQE
ncbi:hypothetical protein Gotri_004379 [Gossypium trilobum]|uniref:Vacuolar ATPase assembly integral membrane protein VMA21 homolog n=1 Tax=Gossypium trilobum TaxID=34281 RepID=A0A7J9F4N0_9ROSI|nr:hypothetical protein [Gossypium trilobum]